MPTRQQHQFSETKGCPTLHALFTQLIRPAMLTWFSVNGTHKTSDSIPSHSGSYNCSQYFQCKHYIEYHVQQTAAMLSKVIIVMSSVRLYCGLYCGHEFLLDYFGIKKLGKVSTFQQVFHTNSLLHHFFLTMALHSHHTPHNDRDSQTTHLLCLFHCQFSYNPL